MAGANEIFAMVQLGGTSSLEVADIVRAAGDAFEMARCPQRVHSSR
jgi:hypothetical protein